MAYGAPHEQYFFVDNWEATLQAGIGTGDTVLSIEGALVDALATPTPSSTRRYLATLEEGATREIVEITGRDTGADTVTVVRARQGTTAAAFGAGAKVQMRPTAVLASLLGIGGINEQGNIFIGAFKPGGALTSTAFRNVLIGNSAGNQVTTGDDNTVVGNGALVGETTGNANTAVGGEALENAAAGSAHLSAFGYRAGRFAGNASARLTYLGALADSNTGGLTDGLALGYGALLRANNQVVIGSGSSPLTDVYIGEGVQDGTPPQTTLNATGGSGTNIAGGDLRIAGGKGTGTGAGGKVLIATAAAGASGSAQNALTDRAEWDSAGLLHTYGALKTGDPGGGAGEWKLGVFTAGAVSLDTANYVEVSIGGAVRKLLVAA
jgi:hypothetical protein